MIISLLALATSNLVVESIITGVGIGTGVYCASRTKKNTYMPKKAK